MRRLAWEEFHISEIKKNPSAWQQRLRRHRYFVLLLLLVCSIIVRSIERRFTGLTAIAELLLGVSLFAMVLVVFEGRRSRLVALWAAEGWGDLYYLFDLLVPGSFTISPDLAAQYADPQARSGLFNYFSLATITSVGYGDIAPIRGPMTAIAMLETVFGQFYLAVVVAQLVGIRLAQGTQDKDGG